MRSRNGIYTITKAVRKAYFNAVQVIKSTENFEIEVNGLENGDPRRHKEDKRLFQVHNYVFSNSNLNTHQEAKTCWRILGSIYVVC